MTPSAEASGRAFLGLIRYVKDHHPTRLADVVARSGTETREAFKSPIKAMAWYPYGAFTSLLESLDARFGLGHGPFLEKLGAATGERDIGTILRVYAALASPERLIRSCAKVWPSYYRNAGRMEAVTWQPEGTALRIYDFAEMHPNHCRLMEGWMKATMRQIGFRVLPGARELECPSHGGRYHEFACTWERIRDRSDPAI